MHSSLSTKNPNIDSFFRNNTKVAQEQILQKENTQRIGLVEEKVRPQEIAFDEQTCELIQSHCIKGHKSGFGESCYSSNFLLCF